MKQIKEPEKECFYDGYYIVINNEPLQDGKIDGEKVWIHPEYNEEDQNINLKTVSENYPDAKFIIWESFLTGKIYRFNNYNDGLWTCIGELSGFA